jgi:hypothetical protein
LVGDSFSFGWGIAEGKRYSDLLELKLKVKIYNISIPESFEGYEKLIHYTQKQGVSIRNLIVGVCMENDLCNYDVTPEERNIHQTDINNIKDCIKAFFESRSAAYLAITSLIHQSRFLERIFIKLGIVGDYNGYARRAYSKEAIDSSVRKLVEMVKPFNAYIVIIPSRYMWAGHDQEVEKQVHVEFINSLREAGLKVIDLKSYFEEGGNPMQYCFKKNGHWNEKGHQKAAEVLADYFEHEFKERVLLSRG